MKENQMFKVFMIQAVLFLSGCGFTFASEENGVMLHVGSVKSQLLLDDNVEPYPYTVKIEILGETIVNQYGNSNVIEDFFSVSKSWSGPNVAKIHVFKNRDKIGTNLRVIEFSGQAERNVDVIMVLSITLMKDQIVTKVTFERSAESDNEQGEYSPELRLRNGSLRPRRYNF